MTVLIHVPIGYPHHNHTVLRFFNDAGRHKASTRANLWLLAKITASRAPGVFAVFMAVLRWRRRSSPKRKQIVDRDSSFTVRLNTSLWLALLSGGIKPAQFTGISGRGSLRSVPRAEIRLSTRFVVSRRGGILQTRAASPVILRARIRAYAASCSISPTRMDPS